jgi:hypothetical protein
MKKAAFGLALLLGGAAFAQTHDLAPAAAYDGDGTVTASFETEGATGLAADAPAVGTLVQPGNSAPERDARGIAVISDPAFAPPGWNGVPAGGLGGPELDPATGEPAAPDDYPPCTAAVTDNCLQTYE